MKLHLCILLWLVSSSVTLSQETVTFSIEFKNDLLSNALTTIEKTCKVRFSYQDDIVKDKRITLKKNKHNFSKYFI